MLFQGQKGLLLTSITENEGSYRAEGCAADNPRREFGQK